MTTPKFPPPHLSAQNRFAAREHDLQGLEAIASEAVSPCEPADAASQGKPTHAFSTPLSREPRDHKGPLRSPHRRSGHPPRRAPVCAPDPPPRSAYRSCQCDRASDSFRPLSAPVVRGHGHTRTAPARRDSLPMGRLGRAPQDGNDIGALEDPPTALDRKCEPTCLPELLRTPAQLTTDIVFLEAEVGGSVHAVPRPPIRFFPSTAE